MGIGTEGVEVFLSCVTSKKFILFAKILSTKKGPRSAVGHGDPLLKHGGGLTELRSWIGRRNNDGMADGIETEMGQV